MKTAWLLAALFVVAFPIALGPATAEFTRWLGGEPEHVCMCGMKRGTCGCPACERLEAERRADARTSKLATVHRSCEGDDGVIAPPALPACAPLGERIAVLRAPSRAVFVAPVTRLQSELAREPSTPPPRA
jgi:hypothetical protein